jgi:hypothetical protein
MCFQDAASLVFTALRGYVRDAVFLDRNAAC